MAKTFFVILVALASLAACKQKNEKNAVQFSGFVVWEKEYTTFTDCNTGKEYWLQDPDGKIAEKIKGLATSPYQQVFFTLEGDLLPPSTTGISSTFDNIMKVNKVVAALAEPPQNACTMKGSKPAFDCTGQNPTWELTTTSDIKFSSNFPKDTLVFFPLAEPSIRDSVGVGKVFHYTIGNENFQSIEIIIIEKPCQIANGKINRFTSKVIFGGVTYNGCAKLKIIPNETAPTADIISILTGKRL